MRDAVVQMMYLCDGVDEHKIQHTIQRTIKIFYKIF